jgi:predicted RNA-binding Zn ribbon-like protein
MSLANRALGSISDLRAWLEEGGADPAASSEGSLRLREFVVLRSSIRDLFEASTSGGPFPTAAVEHLNDASERVPRVLRLEPPSRLEVPLPGSATSLLMAQVAWEAIDLVGGEDRERLRRCPACGRFFLATRTDRRWCSAACGNRTRVARHHARRRGSAR